MNNNQATLNKLTQMRLNGMVRAFRVTMETRSASKNPGLFSFQSAKVLTGICFFNRSPDLVVLIPRPCLFFLQECNILSIVDALIDIILFLSFSSSLICPWRSSAGINIISS